MVVRMEVNTLLTLEFEERVRERERERERERGREGEGGSEGGSEGEREREREGERERGRGREGGREGGRERERERTLPLPALSSPYSVPFPYRSHSSFPLPALPLFLLFPSPSPSPALFPLLRFPFSLPTYRTLSAVEAGVHRPRGQDTATLAVGHEPTIADLRHKVSWDDARIAFITRSPHQRRTGPRNPACRSPAPRASPPQEQRRSPTAWR
jgi:hypothetical protein